MEASLNSLSFLSTKDVVKGSTSCYSSSVRFYFLNDIKNLGKSCRSRN